MKLDWKPFELWEEPTESQAYWVTLKHIQFNGKEIRYVKELWYDVGHKPADTWLKWEAGWYEHNPAISSTIQSVQPNRLWLAWCEKTEVQPFEG